MGRRDLESRTTRAKVGLRPIVIIDEKVSAKNLLKNFRYRNSFIVVVKIMWTKKRSEQPYGPGYAPMRGF